MTSVSVYLLKVNLLLSVLYLFYFLFLCKETFVKANRVYFLSGIVVSLTLPFFTYTKVVMVKAVPFLDVTRFTSVEEGVLPVQNFWDSLTAEQIALGLYVVVVFVLMLRLVKRIYNLVQYLKSLPQSPFDKNTLIDSDTKEAYSFWKWIILPQNEQVAANSDIIIAHEAIHVKQRHTIDVLIINVLKNILWFNPLLILMQKAISLNLEYIVDQEISKKFDVYQYQMTLIQFEKAKTQPFALVNSFAFPSLKKRVLMLNTQKSPIMKKLKFVLTAPILAAFFLSFQIKVKAEVLSAIQTEYKNVTSKELVVQNDTLADGKEVLTLHKAELEAQQKELEMMHKELEIQQQELEKMHEELKVQKEELVEKQSKTTALSRVETEKRKAEIKLRRTEAEQQRTEVKARLAELKAEREKEFANRKAEMTVRKKEMESRRAEAEQQRTEIKAKHAEWNENRKLANGTIVRKADGSVEIISDDEVLEITYNEDGKNTFKTKGKSSTWTIVSHYPPVSTSGKALFVDGKKTSWDEFEKVKPDDLGHMQIITGEKAVEKYGESGTNGIIEVTTKNK